MRWVVFCLLFVACSQNQTHNPKATENTKTPEPGPIPQPQVEPCKATHEEPFKCGMDFEQTESMRDYSLIIDSELTPLPTSAKIPNIPHNLFQIHIISKKSESLAKLLKNNLFVADIDLGNTTPNPPLFRHYWEPDVHRWDNIISRILSESPLPVLLPKHPWVTDAWNQVLKKQGKKTVEFFTANGCAGHCIITTKHESLEKHKITEIFEYISGLTIRHQVIIEQTGLPVLHSRFAIIEIDPTESPNLVYVFDDNLEIYDRGGELLVNSPRKADFEKLQDEMSTRDAHPNSPSSAVVICDTGAKPSKLTNFKVGPRTDLSFWGWLTPEDNQSTLSLFQQVSGAYVLSELNYMSFNEIGVGEHGASVAHIATEQTNLSVISMSADQCLSGYKLWKDNVKPHARVINMSAWFPYDHDSCTNEPRFKDSVRDREQPFLWVVGAGNDARKGLLAKNTSYCPQSLGGRDNLIVVSALNAGYSNDGVDYADIAADGTGYFPREMGTSFASPRVARVAAILAEEFPGLSIAQIKQAIMQGAYIPTPRLANRSGGILDEAGARRIAKQLSAK